MIMATERRAFIIGGSALITSTLALPVLGLQQKEKTEAPKEDDVSTNEDLMREHGVLNRILLIYDEALRRIQAKQKFDTDPLLKAAGLIQKFIEDYHEKLEEDYLFPRFEKAGKLVDLTRTLREQHKAGRTLTQRIMASVKGGDLQTSAAALAGFIRMYRPHEAREDTVLFPALHDIVSKHEYDALGEDFDRIEHQTFGGDGFDIAVDQVTMIEKQLGIYDLSQFTPK